MLKIRLTRVGRRKQPHFRIVVCEHTQAVKGKSLEIIGFYNPLARPSTFKIKKDRLDFWLKRGAHLSETVAHLLKREGLKIS